MLGKQVFRNRILASPQQYPGLTADKTPTRYAMASYEIKARGGYASVCIADCMADSSDARGIHTLLLHVRILPNWRLRCSEEHLHRHAGSIGLLTI